MRELNLNETVKVKLNPLGLRLLREQHEEFCREHDWMHTWQAPKVDEAGYSSFQLWVLMRDLGHHLSCGMNCPFDTNIRIPDE